MADVYEIAEETVKAIEFSRNLRASMADDTEDEAREWPPIYHVCRHVLATRGVVEAADAYDDAYASFENIEPVGGVMRHEHAERRETMHDKHHELIVAVRAMKEKNR